VYHGRAMSGPMTQRSVVARPRGPVAIAWVDTPDALAAIAHEIGGLVRDAGEPNVFHEPWMLIPAWRRYGGGADVRVLLVREAGEIVGMVPLVRRRLGPFVRAALFAPIYCVLSTPLVAAGAEAVVVAALLDALEAGPDRLLALDDFTAQGPFDRALDDAIAARGQPAANTRRIARAFLASPERADAYLKGSLSGKKRKELRRQEKRLGEAGALVFDAWRRPAPHEPWLAEFLALEGAGWKGRAGTALAADPNDRAYIEEVVAAAARRDQLDLVALRLDGRPIAMLLSFRGGNGLFTFKIAHDEAHARSSPGVLLELRFLRRVLDDRIAAWADSCAAADHAMIDHLWRERRELRSVLIGRRRADGRIAVAVLAGARRLRHLLADRIRRDFPGIVRLRTRLGW